MTAFHCESCAAQYAQAYSHPTIGPVCPICLRPVASSGTRIKRRGRSGAKGRLAKVALRDMWQCHLCRGPVEPRAQGVSAPTLDHLLPVSLGGSNALANLKLAHAGCNSKRGNSILPAPSLPDFQTVKDTPRPAQTAGRKVLDPHGTGAPLLPVSERPARLRDSVPARAVSFMFNCGNEGEGL